MEHVVVNQTAPLLRVLCRARATLHLSHTEARIGRSLHNSSRDRLGAAGNSCAVLSYRILCTVLSPEVLSRCWRYGPSDRRPGPGRMQAVNGNVDGGLTAMLTSARSEGP